MHDSVMEFVRNEMFPNEIKGKAVLEVGSQDINGSVRTIIKPIGPAKYIGIDSSAGRGVDMVLSASKLVEAFGQDSFDLVLCTEMLEHAKEWRAPIDQMKLVLRPGGLLVITTRSPGFPWHGFPEDHWRFTQNLFAKIFADLDIIILRNDPMQTHPGVFLKARKPVASIPVDLSKIEALPI